MAWLTVKFAVRKATLVQTALEGLSPAAPEALRYVRVVEALRRRLRDLLPRLRTICSSLDFCSEVLTTCLDLLMTIQSQFRINVPVKSRREHARIVTDLLGSLRDGANGEQEKAIIEAVHTTLPPFVLTLTLPEMMRLIPLFLRYLKRHDDVDIQHSILESLARIWRLPLVLLGVQGVQGEGPHHSDRARMLEYCMDLTPLIRDPTLDPAAFVRGYLNRFAVDVLQRIGRRLPG